LLLWLPVYDILKIAAYQACEKNFKKIKKTCFGRLAGKKRSDLFAEVCYKSSPLIAKINPVNPGDKDKPRLISRTYKPQNSHWTQVRSHSGPKPNTKGANGRTEKRVKKKRLERR
jgi:hypothetical protein